MERYIKIYNSNQGFNAETISSLNAMNFEENEIQYKIMKEKIY